jgi:hypothetical protein
VGKYLDVFNKQTFAVFRVDIPAISADYGAKNRRKLLRCKGNMFKSMGTVLDTLIELKK